MPNIKRYEIDYDWKANVTVEIDHDIVTDDALHELNNFWSNAEWRVEQHDGVLNAVLKMLAREIIYIQFTAGYTIDGLIKQSIGIRVTGRKVGRRWMAVMASKLSTPKIWTLITTTCR